MERAASQAMAQQQHEARIAQNLYGRDTSSLQRVGNALSTANRMTCEEGDYLAASGAPGFTGIGKTILLTKGPRRPTNVNPGRGVRVCTWVPTTEADGQSR